MVCRFSGCPRRRCPSTATNGPPDTSFSEGDAGEFLATVETRAPLATCRCVGRSSRDFEPLPLRLSKETPIVKRCFLQSRRFARLQSLSGVPILMFPDSYSPRLRRVRGETRRKRRCYRESTSKRRLRYYDAMTSRMPSGPGVGPRPFPVKVAYVVRSVLSVSVRFVRPPLSCLRFFCKADGILTYATSAACASPCGSPAANSFTGEGAKPLVGQGLGWVFA